MNLKNIGVSACLLSAAVSSFAGQGAFNSAAFESLQQAAAGADQNAIYDNAAVRAAASQGTASARTLAYRESDAPSVIAVDHRYSNPYNYKYGDLKCTHSGACAFYEVMHPASELKKSKVPFEVFLGHVLSYVLTPVRLKLKA